MMTCYHCAKTNKTVNRRVSVPQSVFGDWVKTSTGYASKPDLHYWYHEKCYQVAEKKAALELFGEVA